MMLVDVVLFAVRQSWFLDDSHVASYVWTCCQPDSRTSALASLTASQWEMYIRRRLSSNAIYGMH